MRICVFEDAGVGDLEPLTPDAAGVRPALRRRRRCWSGSCAASPRARSASWCGRRLADLCRLTHPNLPVNDAAWLRRGPTVLVNARWLPPAEQLALTGRAATSAWSATRSPTSSSAGTARP